MRKLNRKINRCEKRMEYIKSLGSSVEHDISDGINEYLGVLFDTYHIKLIESTLRSIK